MIIEQLREGDLSDAKSNPVRERSRDMPPLTSAVVLKLDPQPEILGTLNGSGKAMVI
jgi:hypothetical protein